MNEIGKDEIKRSHLDITSLPFLRDEAVPGGKA